MKLRKLYGHTRKRLAKKYIGSIQKWRKLHNGLQLQPGDLVSTCKGWNERIKEIIPEFIHTRRGWVIYDFDIITESGNGCSLCHCCTFPRKTKEEVIAYLKSWLIPEAKQWCEEQGYNFHKTPLLLAIEEGKDAIDSDGRPYEEYL